MTRHCLHLLPALSAVLMLCLLPACGSGDDEGSRELPSHPEALADEMDRATGQLIEAIKAVRDTDSMRAAQDRLAAAREQIHMLKGRMEQLQDQFSEEQLRELEARARASAREMSSELAAEITRIARDPELREALSEINRMLIEELSPYQ